MIYSDEGYELVQEQLTRLQKALLSLREEMAGKNADWLRMLAEPYEEQMDALKAELRAYDGERLKPPYLQRYRRHPAFFTEARHALAA